jgi:hypothetical protein
VLQSYPQHAAGYSSATQTSSGHYSPQQTRVQRNIRCRAQPSSETFRLVEFALALLGRMERNRNDPIPAAFGYFRAGPLDEQFGQKGLKPERVLVFIPMDYFEHLIASHHSRASGAKVPFMLSTIRAFEGIGDRSLEGKTAPTAKGRIDKAH